MSFKRQLLEQEEEEEEEESRVIRVLAEFGRLPARVGGR